MPYPDAVQAAELKAVPKSLRCPPAAAGRLHRRHRGSIQAVKP